MKTTEGFIEVHGGKVWYQKHDLGTNKTPVIMLHGGPGSSHFSMQGLKALAKDRPVIFYDQLGCGNSDRPKDTSLWTLDRFVDEVDEVIKSLNVDQIHILGHSWGTTLAAAYYLQKKPSNVKSIIFSSPCLSAPLWADDQEENRKLLPEAVQATLKRCEENDATDSEEYKAATMEFYKRFVCRLDPWPEIIKKGAKYKGPEVYKTMWGPSEFHVTGNLKSFDCTNELKNIDISTLYTCGRYDEATPKSTKYFSDLTPNSQLHIFEHSAHMPYLEETEEYLRVVGEFLKKND